jgi:integrase
MGTLRQRSTGTWELIVSTGRNPGTGRYGRVIRTVRTPSKREAKAALSRLEVEVASGRVGVDDPTLAELFELWMAHLRTLGRSHATLYNYQRYIDREIVPVLGGMRLSKLTARDLDALYTKLSDRGLAPATVRQVHAVLRASLNQAERWGLVGRSVAKLATAPSQPQREQHPPSASEVQALIEAASHVDARFGLHVRVVAATGARRSEACGIRWSDVDLETGRLTIERTYQVLPGVKGDRPTKTRSTRSLTLDHDTLAALRVGWEEAVGLADAVGCSTEERRTGYMFTHDPMGAGAWRPDVVNSRWQRTRRAALSTGSVRLHDLRHWHATQLLDAGVPVPTVAARLGHTDGTTTMKIYAHRTERADEHAAVVVGKAGAVDDFKFAGAG